MPPKKVTSREEDDDDYVPDHDPSDDDYNPPAPRPPRTRRARRARRARGPTFQDEVEDIPATADTPAEASRRPAVESGDSNDDASVPRVPRRSRYYRRIVLDDDDIEDEAEDKSGDKSQDRSEDKAEDKLEAQDEGEDNGKGKDNCVGNTPATNLPIRPRRGPGPNSSPTAVTTPTNRPRPVPAPENTPRSAVDSTGPTHMVAVQCPEGLEEESEILARIPAGEVVVSSTSTSTTTSTSQGPSSSRPAPRRPTLGPSVIRLPSPIRAVGAPPPWPAVSDLAENQFDYIREQFEPILNTLGRWSFITIERRQHSNRGVWLTDDCSEDGASSEDGAHSQDGARSKNTGRYLGNLEFNIRIWRPRGDCRHDCQQCRAEYTRFGVPRWGDLPRDVEGISEGEQAIQPQETTEQSESNDDSNKKTKRKRKVKKDGNGEGKGEE